MNCWNCCCTRRGCSAVLSLQVLSVDFYCLELFPAILPVALKQWLNASPSMAGSPTTPTPHPSWCLVIPLVRKLSGDEAAVF